ncbi:MATE family efflux transporter [Vibrio diabolicus]|uniref:MATE family efflux transporter n=1 Tax=Vibrio diabolicus TaxID=50719 RepID=UPI003753DF6B
MFDNLIGKVKWAFILKVLSSAIGFISTFLIGYILTPTDAGKYFYFLGLVMSIGGLARIGLDNLTLKSIPEYLSQAECHNSDKHISVSCLICIVNSIFILIITKVFFDIDSDIYDFLCFALIPFAVINVFGVFFQARGDVKKGLLISSVLPQAINVILLLVLTQFNKDLISVMSAYCISFVFVLGGLFKYIKKYFVRVQFADFLSVIKKAKSFMMISLLGILNVNYPIILISNFLPIENSAYYSVSMKLATINVFVLSAVNSVVAPKFSFYKKQNEHNKIKSLAKKSTRMMLACALPVCFFILLFPEDILNFFGDEYINETSVLCLRILAIAQFINVSTGATSYLLQMVGHSHTYAFVLAIVTFSSMFISVLAAKSLGFIAVVCVIAASIVLLNVFSVLLVRLKLNFWMI